MTTLEYEALQRGETVIVGAKTYRLCGICMCIVQTNKRFIGSMHRCDSAKLAEMRRRDGWP